MQCEVRPDPQLELAFTVLGTDLADDGLIAGRLIGVGPDPAFDRERARAHRHDVFVDVFFLALEVAVRSQPERVDPQAAQRALVGGADGNLLNT